MPITIDQHFQKWLSVGIQVHMGMPWAASQKFWEDPVTVITPDALSVQGVDYIVTKGNSLHPNNQRRPWSSNVHKPDSVEVHALFAHPYNRHEVTGDSPLNPALAIFDSGYLLRIGEIVDLLRTWATKRIQPFLDLLDQPTDLILKRELFAWEALKKGVFDALADWEQQAPQIESQKFDTVADADSYLQPFGPKIKAIREAVGNFTWALDDRVEAVFLACSDPSQLIPKFTGYLAQLQGGTHLFDYQAARNAMKGLPGTPPVSLTFWNLGYPLMPHHP